MIHLGPEVCGDLEQALSREWLETNGLGGFASGTVAGVHTRRYHGLLTAALRPPVDRHVLLSRLEETLVVDGERYELAANQYPGVVHPQGYRWLAGFRLDPFPVFSYRVPGPAGDVELEKTVFMVHGEDTTVVRWAVTAAPAGAELRLEVRPLLALRDYHCLARENDAVDRRVEAAAGRVTVRPYPGLPGLHLAHTGELLSAAGDWYRRFQYAEERERGLDCEEDLYLPCTLALPLSPERPAAVVASLSGRAAGDAEALREAEVTRRSAVAARAPGDTPSARQLALAADQFLVRRAAGKTIIAGYPWFTDWGRDTMIALPGLCLVTGRFDEARAILAEFARHMDGGLLPNRFPDDGEEAEYNTVDATLWYFEAVRRLGEATGDFDWIRDQLYPVLRGSVAWHLRGTRHGIGVDADGLLRAGEEGYQLTWMDAKVADWVVTPRRGKPVEIQALWYHALRVMEDLAERFGDREVAGEYARHARKAARSFNAAFWNADAGCLYDVLAEDGPDPSIRPNQLLAVSLPHSMLSARRARDVVRVAQERLLTPRGLRSLDPADPRYAGVYTGDQWSRDGRYHQGTVWAWLLGPFLTAYVRVNGRSPESRRQAAEWLRPLLEQHLPDAGLGSISEIFDGDPPHRPRGCPYQAWSVAEVLRVLAEDLGGAPG